MGRVSSLNRGIYEDVVLSLIESEGIDRFKVWSVADRLGVSIGVLYRLVGLREQGLELVWHQVVHRINDRLAYLLDYDDQLEFEHVWDAVRMSLPYPHVRGFLELHHARRRWRRDEVEADGAVLPALEHVIAVLQRSKKIRAGPPSALAAIVWEVLTGALGSSGEPQQDRLRLAERCIAEAFRVRPGEVSLEDPRPQHVGLGH